MIKRFLYFILPRTWPDVAAALVTLFVMAIGLHYWWQVNREGNPPIIVNSVDIQGDSNSFAVGEIIVVVMDYCRLTDAPAEYSGRLVDTWMYPLAPLHVEGGPADCRVISFPIPVPDVPGGTYYIEFFGAYEVNSRVTRVVKWRTPDFYILP